MSRRDRLNRTTDPSGVLVQQSAQSLHVGPLPSPDVLREYEDLLPGTADRLLTSFEEQARHRMALEREVIIADIRRANLGLWTGFIVAILFLLASIGLAMTGHETVAIALGTVDIIGLVTTFVIGTLSRRGERVEKQKSLLKRSP